MFNCNAMLQIQSKEVLYKIQNWDITEAGIKWSGSVKVNYFLDKRKLLDSWITIEDICALNTAYIIALSIYGISLPENISLAKTIDLQLKRL
jgi:hypothetical protein